MNKLLAILYAGYPYNGMNMYTVVDSTRGISEDAFNALLNPPSWIRSDFPDSIGDTEFSYSDYPDNKANLAKLTKFVQDERTRYYSTGASTPSGHTSAEIRATPFYQAAVAMAYAPSYNETPLKVYNMTHSDENAVTEAQAYEATQYAIWAVLGDYGIKYNSLTSKSGEVTQKALAVKLLNNATADNVLRAEPDAGNVKITGDSQFAYDPEYGVWKTGAFMVGEGKNYHGTYTLTLPSGVSAHEPDGTPVTKVTAGTKFFLASTDRPTSTDMEITASDTLTWLQEYRQYSPSPETYTASDGNNFQHMIGAVIKQKPVSAKLALAPAADGNLTVSKSVVGETNSQTDFTFTVTLGDTGVNGTYGGMTFTNGVATVTLKDGESATAEHLPAGIGYTVAEAENSHYDASKTGDTGDIPNGSTVTAAFTNTFKTGDLAVTKHVSGDISGAQKKFDFTVTLSGDGSSLDGTYGGMTFTDGVATCKLGDGETATATGLPAGIDYEVTEAAADGYTTTSENATGTIEHGRTSEASFTNARIGLPLSGMGGIGPMLLIGLALLVAAAIWIATRKLRFAPTGKHSEGQGDER